MLELLISLAIAIVPQQPGRAELAGTWTLNTLKSDDADERVSIANRPKGGGGGIRPGIPGGVRRSPTRGQIPPRVPGRPEPREPGQLPPGDRDIPGDTSVRVGGTSRKGLASAEGTVREALEALVYGSEKLQLTVTGSTVQFDSTFAVRTNGKEIVQRRFGRYATIKAEWKKNKLVIETKIEDEIEAKEEYEIKMEDDAKYLRVYVELKLPTGRTVKVQRYYDR